MKTPCLSVMVVFACLFFVDGKSYAWDNICPEAVIEGLCPRWTHVDHPLKFDGSESYDPDGRIDAWEWDFGDGTDPCSCDSWCGPPGPNIYHTYSVVDDYWAGLDVTDEDGCTSGVYCKVYVVEWDVTLGPGEISYLPVNNDDDNENGVMDIYDEGTVTGEDDLVKILLSVSTPKSTDKIRVSLGGDTPQDNLRIKVWSDSDKGELVIPYQGEYYREWATDSYPTELWVEAVQRSNVGSPKVMIHYFAVRPRSEELVSREPPADVSFTFLEVDGDMEGLKDDDYHFPTVTEETTPGGFISLNDDDDDGDGTPDKDQTGPVTGEDDLVKLTVSKVWPDELTGYVSLSAVGADKIQVWDNATKDGFPINLPQTYYTPSDLPKELWVEGIEVSTSNRDITLVLEYTIDGHTFEDRVNVTVLGVTGVEWRTYPDNISLTECPKNGGYRMFPGKKTSDDPDGDDRRKVTVKATLNAPVDSDDNIHVMFTCWDVDDSSATTGPIDSGDSDPDPNNHSIDNRGSFNFSGGDSCALVHADSSEVEAIFEVSMKPGDNYRVTATTRDLAPGQLTHYMVETGNLPCGVKRTPMLTTWRKLWIEQDSMGAVPETGDQKNHVAGTASEYEPYQPPPVDRTWIHLGQNLPGAFDDDNQFKYGTYIADTNSYSTRGSTGYTWPWEDKVKVKGDPNSDGVPMAYKLYDDDQASLPKYPSLGSWESAFHDAYIDPDYLPSDYSTEVPFVRNLSSGVTGVAWGAGSWNDYYDCPSSSDFWTELVVGSFQPETSHDFDPDSEESVVGAAKVQGDDNQCVIYYETLRDVTGTCSEDKQLAHEIGHGAGIEDNQCEEGCLMWVDENNQIGDHFCDECLLEMRKDTTY